MTHTILGHHRAFPLVDHVNWAASSGITEQIAGPMPSANRTASATLSVFQCSAMPGKRAILCIALGIMATTCFVFQKTVKKIFNFVFEKLRQTWNTSLNPQNKSRSRYVSSSPSYCDTSDYFFSSSPHQDSFSTLDDDREVSLCMGSVDSGPRADIR